MLRADPFGDRFLHCMGTGYLHIKLNVKIGKKGEKCFVQINLDSFLHYLGTIDTYVCAY